MYKFVIPIHYYNFRVLKNSSMFTIIDLLFIINHPQWYVKYVTNKAYPRNDNFRLTFNWFELAKIILV